MAAKYNQASTCKLLCALENVDKNAIEEVEYDDSSGEDSWGRYRPRKSYTVRYSALTYAVKCRDVDCVSALLEFNVDTSKEVFGKGAPVEIKRLRKEHRNRSVEERNMTKNNNTCISKIHFKMCQFCVLERGPKSNM